MNAAVAMLSALLPRSVAAQGWSGTTSSDWTVATNWVAAFLPSAGVAAAISTASPNPTILGVSGAASAAVGGFGVAQPAASSGSLTIQNGSTLTSGGTLSQVGSGTGSTGIVTVTGAGSRWIVSSTTFIIGNAGNGTLKHCGWSDRRRPEQVKAPETLPEVSGTLNISGGSVLETTALVAGSGARQMNFDSGTVRALASNSNFFGGSINQVNIAAGGLTVDTSGSTVGTLGFSGVGGRTKTGAGTFSLRSASTRTGETVIQQEHARVDGPGSLCCRCPCHVQPDCRQRNVRYFSHQWNRFAHPEPGGDRDCDARRQEPHRHERE